MLCSQKRSDKSVLSLEHQDVDVARVTGIRRAEEIVVCFHEADIDREVSFISTLVKPSPDFRESLSCLLADEFVGNHCSRNKILGFFLLAQQQSRIPLFEQEESR